MLGRPAVTSSTLYHIAVFGSLVAGARKNVMLIFVVFLVVETVMGIGVEGVEVVRVVVKRVDGLFVLRRVFLLLMLWVGVLASALEARSRVEEMHTMNL
jgi:hypothetical protein